MYLPSSSKLRMIYSKNYKGFFTMHACTFFGHRDCPIEIKPKLEEVLSNLILQYNVTRFYVGNQGSFDSLVYSVLKSLKLQYPIIQYTVVLAYLPTNSTVSSYAPYETLLPEGIENIPKRFAISWRNKWMLKKCDYVVAYVTHSWGGAAKNIELAEHQHKKVFNLSQAKE